MHHHPHPLLYVTHARALIAYAHAWYTYVLTATSMQYQLYNKYSLLSTEIFDTNPSGIYKSALKLGHDC